MFILATKVSTPAPLINQELTLVPLPRQIRRQFSKYTPPALPVSNNNTSSNPYANNPPPPSNYTNNQYGSNPPPPPNTYQPSMAGQYATKAQNPNTVVQSENQHEHGYEWEQAREQERLEREGAEAPPPGYNMSPSELFSRHIHGNEADEARCNGSNELCAAAWSTDWNALCATARGSSS
jgi:hypothetical protein